MLDDYVDMVPLWKNGAFQRLTRAVEISGNRSVRQAYRKFATNRQLTILAAVGPLKEGRERRKADASQSENLAIGQ